MIPTPTPGQIKFVEESRKYAEEYPENTTQKGVYSPRVPDIQIKFFHTPTPIPSSVYLHVLETLALMVPVVGDPPQTTNPTVIDVARGFEESRIVIGLPPEDEAEALECYLPRTPLGDEPNPLTPQSRAVAVWSSGISTGCSQTLFLNNDGTFYWTEP